MNGETKHRRTNPSIGENGCSEELGLPLEAVDTEISKIKGHASKPWCVQWILRRWRDVFGVTFFVLKFAVGYMIADLELRPLDSVDVKFWRLFGYIIMIVFFVSWCGTLYHGPGRPDRSLPPNGSQFTSHVASAFNAGQTCQSRGFSSEDSWCGKCDKWKPSLASHCKTCQRCCYWMDHHCVLIGQCVGFRNLRCFLVMLLYGQLIHAYLFLAIARRLFTNGLQWNWWECGKLAVWFVYICQGSCVTGNMLRVNYELILRGWPSRVIHAKFLSLRNHAVDLHNELNRKIGYHDVVDDLAQAVAALECRRNILLHSPFFGRSSLGFSSIVTSPCLAFVFGEEPTWRWFLPFRPGGMGSPLCFCLDGNTKACDSWVLLGTAIERGRLAVERAQAAEV